MKKLLLFLIFIPLIISCTIEPRSLADVSKNNPFTTPVYSTENQDLKDFSFLLISDTHYLNKSGRMDEVFFQYLSDNELNYDFAVHLGDITDNSEDLQFELFEKDFSKFFDLKATGTSTLPPLFALLGNHDVRSNPNYYFLKLFGKEKTYYRFDFNGVHFYALDSSFRTLGGTQLDYFKYAMDQESSSEVPIIVLSHIPLYGSPSLIYAALEDNVELATILKSIKTGGASLILSGHEHVGNSYHRFENNFVEFIASSFIYGGFRKLSARFYLCHFDAKTRTLNVDSFTYVPSTRTFDVKKKAFAFTL